VEIVFADKDSGRPLRAGKIQRLVKPGMICGAVAKERNADVVASLRPRAHSRSDGMAYARRNNAVCPEQSDGLVIEMHRATTAAATAVAFSQELRHKEIGGHPLG